jgi:hypothetical protein
MAIRMTKTLLWAVTVILVVVITAWLVTPSALERDAPRDLPWELPDYRTAMTRWHVDSKGLIHAEVEHFFLEGISPEMVIWFYQQLPISTVSYRGTVIPLYHIFHPTEHGRIRVLEDASNGVPGMGKGGRVMREEWFGPYDSRGAARIEEFSSMGMLAIPEVAGLAFGEVRHSFKALNGGTFYRVDAVIGSQMPLLGGLINYYLRTWVFHPAMMAQWQRHQIEEVASLQFFLNQIYAQKDQGNHFLLEDISASGN